MSHSLDFEVSSVLPFMKGLMCGLDGSEGMQAIGLRKDGELIAGVLFDGINGKNAWMHVAAKPGCRWMTRYYLRACFHYPFVTCGVDRISGHVNESNAQARRFDEHLGFKEEARLKGAAPDGGDVILYVMWRQDCRFLGAQHGR